MAKFDERIVKNPEIFQENRLNAHSDHEWYTTREHAKDGVSDCKYSLNGTWRIHYANNPSLTVEGFEKEEYSVDGWDQIPVPAHVQMQGYGHPQYVNTQYPWDGIEEIEPGEIPTKFNPVAQYVRYFTLPEEMKGGPVYISFQGVESGFALWVNGEYVGYSEDSFTPSEFDISSFVHRQGENKLAVQVYRYTAGSWCEDQDFFRFSGIFRDVYLYTVPVVHVRDLKIETILDDQYENATLQLTLKVEGSGEMHFELYDPEEEETIIEKKCAAEPEIKIKLPVRKPRKWSAEDPQLYHLKITACDGERREVEYICEKVGFRRFELKDGVMCINGERIVFRGVNRHEFSAKSGRVISVEDMLCDVITMKQNNIYAIRTSHYPNRSELYRLCDEFGLYMIDETNMETHGVWDAIIRGVKPIEYALPGDRPQYLEMILDRAHSMYERDKNHPSILIWSCGNESFGGKDILEMSNRLRSWDSNRLVHYEGVVNDNRYPDSTDMVSTMYWPVEQVEAYLKENRNKPFIHCEYAHAMGNSLGNMYKYTDLTEKEKLYQGGFIWDYIDQSLTMKDRYGVTFEGYGGDFGDRPNDGSFSGNGLCYGKDRDPSPKMQEVKKLYQPVKIEFSDKDMIITNKNLFINTEKYNCVITLEREGDILESHSGRIEVQPQSQVKLPIPFEIPEDGEYVVTVSFQLREEELWAAAEHEVAFGQQVYGHEKKKQHVPSQMKVVHGWNNIGVYTNGYEILFSNLFGGLVSYRHCGRELIKQAPKPNFWRPMTENDLANQLPYRAGQWKAASMYVGTRYEHGRKYTNAVVKEGEDTVEVSFVYHLATRPQKDATLRYLVHSDGVIDVNLTMEASDDVGELPAFGMLFTMDADYHCLKWYGLGPEETYVDRREGGRLGVWENDVKDNMAKYLRPQECGNKVEVRYAEVTDEEGFGLRFEGDNLSFSALPYTPHEIDCAQHTNELPPVLSTTVRVESMQMGVGGDDTWGALTHPEYLLDNSKPMEVSFSFYGIG